MAEPEVGQGALPKPRSSTAQPPAAIELSGVEFAYTQGVPVLEQVDFVVREGDFLGLIGPNGGGKTTLLKIVLGLLVPQRGTARVLDRDPRELHTGRQLLGYVPQDTAVARSFPVTVLDVVLMGTYGRLGLFRRPGSREQDSAREVVERVGLGGLEQQPAWELSGGQMQRMAIARALVSRPRLLLFDEPTSGLDTGGQSQLFQLLERLKEQYRLTIVMVSHDVTALAHYAGQVACLNRRLHWHDRSELLSEAVLQKVYGCELEAFFVRHREHLADFHGHQAPAGRAQLTAKEKGEQTKEKGERRKEEG